MGCFCFLTVGSLLWATIKVKHMGLSGDDRLPLAEMRSFVILLGHLASFFFVCFFSGGGGGGRRLRQGIRFPWI